MGEASFGVIWVPQEGQKRAPERSGWPQLKQKAGYAGD